MDRDFDMQTRTAVLQPRVCQIAVRLYVHLSALKLDSTSVRALAQSINTDPEGANS